MSILAKLFGLGIPTYTTTIYTPVPNTAAASFQVGKNLPKEIGRIFGMAIYSDGFTPDNKDLLTTTDAFNMYLTLKVGASDFVEEHRLSDMLTFVSGSPITTRSDPFMQVNIPNGLDISTSKYLNPTGIVAGGNNKTVSLKLWYIGFETYNQMIKDGVVGKYGEMFNSKKG